MKKDPVERTMETVKISLLLQREDYELVRRISTKLGMDTSSWINLTIATKLKEMGPKEVNK